MRHRLLRAELCVRHLQPIVEACLSGFLFCFLKQISGGWIRCRGVPEAREACSCLRGLLLFDCGWIRLEDVFFFIEHAFVHKTSMLRSSSIS